jgi:hypothetical protein
MIQKHGENIWTASTSTYTEKSLGGKKKICFLSLRKKPYFLGFRPYFFSSKVYQPASGGKKRVFKEYCSVTKKVPLLVR